MKKSTLIIIIVVIVIFVLVPLGALFVMGRAIPFTNNVVMTVPFLEVSPAKATEKYAEQMANLKSFYLQTVLSQEVPTTSRSLAVPMQGLSMVIDSDLNLEETRGFGQSKTTIKGDVGYIGQNIDLDLEFLTAGEKLCFKLNKAPTLPAGTGYENYNEILNGLLNQWYCLDLTSLSGLAGGLIDLSQIDTQKLNLSANLTEQLANSKIIKVKKRLPDETINGVKTYHYLIDFDANEIEKIIQETGGSSFNLGLLDPEMLKTTMESYQFEIWIGKKDFYLYQMQMTNDIIPSGMNMTMTFSNFNQPVTVSEPASYKDIQELVAAFMPSTSTTTTDFNTDTDNDNLSDYYENFYGTDPNNPDTDGDGYLDGEEVNHGYNPNGPGKMDIKSYVK